MNLNTSYFHRSTYEPFHVLSLKSLSPLVPRINSNICSLLHNTAFYRGKQYLRCLVYEEYGKISKALIPEFVAYIKENRLMAGKHVIVYGEPGRFGTARSWDGGESWTLETPEGLAAGAEPIFTLLFCQGQKPRSFSFRCSIH